MTIFLTISIMLGIAALLSLFILKKYFHSTELLTFWLFISSMLFIFSNIIELNYKWIRLNNEITVFWILTIIRLIVIPCLCVWLLLIYSSKEINRSIKMICTGLWFVLLIGLQFLLKTLNLIQFKQWNFYFSFVEWLILWFLAVGYWSTFRVLLKKEGVIE
ncbi:hypothetical protein [Fictibacillus barbaricus]|uniref:Uncharacterized protein n=2 Tax=Fictibacillus barbaricus TaxID=182136 RepID=A0ABS2ZI42_9BACL|nr:hypothetical protein [Fictibacillus barbaricus]MBN3546326.1 hypothetical protein [Fictibacillus barbaricus]